MPRLLDWIVDYSYYLRGAGTMYLHRTPPSHYLGNKVSDKAPLIIIPGIRSNWSFLKDLADWLSLKGHTIYVVPKLGYNFYDIPTSAKIVRSVIDENKLKNMVLVAHSKGGLIGQHLLQFENSDGAVLGMVSLAAPYSGSSLARLIPLRPYRELLPGSETIKKLQECRNVNKKIISIAPEFDNHVWSEKGSFLEGALDNIKVPVRGHHRLVFDKKVWELISQSIDRLAKT